MRYLFYLIWIPLLCFGIYLRKKKIVVVTKWLDISMAVAYLVFFWIYVMFLM